MQLSSCMASLYIKHHGKYIYFVLAKAVPVNRLDENLNIEHEKITNHQSKTVYKHIGVDLSLTQAFVFHVQ